MIPNRPWLAEVASEPRCDDSTPAWVLQRVPTARRLAVRDLYWRVRSQSVAQPEQWDQAADGSIAVGQGSLLAFDTYFGAFFEPLWRAHTTLGNLSLRLRVEGAPVLRILRRAPGQLTLLHEAVVNGSADVAVQLETLNFRQDGLVFFELLARDRPVTFHHACWVTHEPPPAPIGLAAVFCTFNRQAHIAAVLSALAADTAVARRLTRIIVVNQGTPGLVRHPAIAPVAAVLGDTLQVIEQANFGGAGGFGRGLLAAMDDPQVDHVAFLDDDIVIEPDSLLRMHAFLSFSRGDVPLGGHMLDSVRPKRLYEAGAVIGDRHWTFHPEHADLDLADVRCLDQLLDPTAIQYNGWWCFAFPLSIVQRLGMPMPCFIRGDDTEFGLRLYANGLHTVSMPGIAVWHEPFYLKLGSWQLYYETRNTLSTMAIHRDFGRWAVVKRMARQILLHLMTYRYYSTALIVRGIEDYLAGPEILRQPPGPVHASLDGLRHRFAVATVARSVVIPKLTVARLPRFRVGYLWALVCAIVRNAVLPSPVSPNPHKLDVEAFSWISLRGADCVALETWWDREMPRLQRSRAHFRTLGPACLRVLARLYHGGPSASAAWRDAHPELTSAGFWRGYLGVPTPAAALRPVEVRDGRERVARLG